MYTNTTAQHTETVTIDTYANPACEVADRINNLVRRAGAEKVFVNGVRVAEPRLSLTATSWNNGTLSVTVPARTKVHAVRDMFFKIGATVTIEVR